MRKLTIALITLIVLIMLSYTGFWFYTASLYKERAIKNLSSLENISFVESASFNDVQISGFPFNILLKISKPKITIDTQALYNASKVVINDPSKKLNHPQTFEFVSEESMAFESNLTGSIFSLIPAKSIQVAKHEKNKVNHYVLSHEGEFRFTSKKIDKGIYDTFMQDGLEDDALAFFIKSLLEYDEFDLNLSGLKLVNSNTQEILFQDKHLDFSMGFRSLAQGDAELNLSTNIENIMIHPSINEWLNELTETSSDLSIDSQARSKLQLTFKGPMDMRRILFGKNDYQFNVKIENISPLLECIGEGDIVFNLDRGQFKRADLVLNHTLNFSPNYKEYLIDYADVLFDKSKLSTQLPSEDTLDLMPNLHELGNINVKLDMSIDESLTERHVHLNDFYFKNNKYSISSKGELRTDQYNASRSDLTLSIEGYEALLDSLSPALNLAFDDDKKDASLPYKEPFEHHTDKLKKLIRAIGVEDESTQAIFHLVFSTRPFEMTVNDLPEHKLNEIIDNIFKG